MNRLAVASLLVLAACPPSGADAPDSGVTVSVKSVDVGGLILYVAGLPGSRTSMGFGLLSPRTGKATPALREVIADGARVMAAGSPDGRTLAWLDGASVLHVATMALDGDGAPTLTEQRTLPMRGSRALAFTDWGDRVVSDEAFANPGPDGGVAACPESRHPPAVAPNGRAWVGDCKRVGTLFDDLTPTLVMPGAPSLELSADGQWVLGGPPLFLPERTVATKTNTPSTVSSPEGNAAPDGVVSTPSFGLDGKRVAQVFIELKSVYRVEDATVVPAPRPRSTPAAMFEGRGPGTEPPGPTPSLNRLPPSDGRGWNSLGVLPDGSAEVWWLVGWDITTTPRGEPQQTPRWSGFQVISRVDGRVTNTLDFSLSGSCVRDAPPQAYGERPRGLVMLGDDGWACSGEDAAGSVGDQTFVVSTPGTWRGLVKGVRAEWGTAGQVLTTDGRAAVGANGATEGQGTALCFTSFSGGPRRCLELPELKQAEPMLSVGHAVAPASGEQASVAWVSHRGAYPGQEVRVFGNRFGASGTLRLGDVAVPAADIVSWSDEEVRFRMPAAAPAVGRVRVDAGRGSDDGARGFFVWKTQRWSGPLGSVPQATMTLHQGLSPLIGVEAGRTRAMSIADHEQASLSLATVVKGTHLLDPAGRCRPSDVLWIAEGPYATNRPLRCTEKLDAAQPWTVVPFGHEWARPEQAPRPFHFYGELITTANTGAAPFFDKPSWLELVRTSGDVVTREPIARPNNEEHAGAPTQGSLITRPDGSVLRAGHRLAPKTLVRTEALDQVGSQWQLRNGTPLGVGLIAASVAELGGKTVVAGTDDGDNLRGVLRVSTDGVAFPTRVVGAASGAGSFAPVFAMPGGRRAGFIGVAWEGNINSWQQGDGVRSLYTLSPTLTFTEAALPPPPGTGSLRREQLDFGVLGRRLYAWNRPAGTLHVLDTDAVTPQWTSVDFTGKRVTAFMVDAGRARILVGAQDTLWRTTADGQAFEPWPSPVQLPVDLGPLTVTSFALDKAGYAHVGVAEWAGAVDPPPVLGSLVGRPVP
jgi:hypothetical protein